MLGCCPSWPAKKTQFLSWPAACQQPMRTLSGDGLHARLQISASSCPHIFFQTFATCLITPPPPLHAHSCKWLNRHRPRRILVKNDELVSEVRHFLGIFEHDERCVSGNYLRISASPPNQGNSHNWRPLAWVRSVASVVCNLSVCPLSY